MYYRWFRSETEKIKLEKGVCTIPKAKKKFDEFMEWYEGEKIRAIHTDQEKDMIFIQVWHSQTTSWWGRLRFEKLTKEQKKTLTDYILIKKNNIILYKDKEYCWGELEEIDWKAVKKKVPEEVEEDDPSTD